MQKSTGGVWWIMGEELWALGQVMAWEGERKKKEEQEQEENEEEDKEYVVLVMEDQEE